MMKQLLIFFCYMCQFVAGTTTAAQNTEIRAVVFDFGGVIAKANTAQMADFFTSTLCIDQTKLKMAFKDMQAYVLRGGSEKQFWRDYAHSLGKTLPETWFSQFDLVISGAITEIPGTILLVKELQKQGYQTSMLSDVTQNQANIIRKLGYYNLFQPAVLSYEIGVEKPNPETFQILLKELKLSAESVLFIDDKIENVEAAKKQGIDSIQFINPKQLKDELECRGFPFHNVNL